MKGQAGIMASCGEDVTTRLIRHFKQSIRDGKYQPGCKLAPERELAVELNVNRSTLRQALKVLQVMGVVDQHVGDGTYLCSDARAVLREPLDFLLLLSGVSSADLFDLRLLVEPELAATAAQRVTTAGLARLLAAIGALENSHTVEQRIEADLAFHEAIFDTSGNRLFLLLFTVIQRAILDSMKLSARWMKLESTVQAHTAIYGAIEKRNPGAARQAVREHLRSSQASLKTRRSARGMPAATGVRDNK